MSTKVDTLTTEGAPRSNLSCYQCTVSETRECSDKFLLPCPSDQPYDHCQTRIRKTRAAPKVLEKGCAVGPCQLHDDSGEAVQPGCDMSTEEYDCVFCCKGHGCNGSRSWRNLARGEIVFGALAAATLLWV